MECTDAGILLYGIMSGSGIKTAAETIRKEEEKMENFTLLRIAIEEDLIEILHETRFNCHEKCPDYISGCLRTCTHDCGREYIKEWLHEESNPEREEEIMNRAINEIKGFGILKEEPRNLVNRVINENKEKLIEEMKKEGKLVTGWIPVEERLLEEDGEYLVTFLIDKKVCLVGYGCCRKDVLGNDIGFGWYDLYSGTYFSDKAFTAWMPLPEPYRPEH